MRRWILPFAVLCGFSVVAPSANATVEFSLSSPTDLSTLVVGQLVEIDVSLSGLPEPNNQTDFIFNLNTRILFSSTLFDAVADPTTLSGLTAVVAPGSAFYDFDNGPKKIANFQAQSSLEAGAANGNFSESPDTTSGAIGLNGLYYSFLVRAKAAGSGSIAFDPTPGANQYAANETGFNFAPLVTTGNLSFTIAPAVVPEPSSIAMAAVGLAFLGGRACLRRRAVG